MARHPLVVRLASIAVAMALAALVLSGCSSKGNGAAAEPTPQAFENLQVTATTGAIRGLVVDEAVRPVANATVKLGGGNGTKTSDAQGAFVFTDLAAGDYFLSVSKPGYFSTQASASVVAGVAEPPVVKVQLKIDAASQPYTEVLEWKAFLQCGAWAVVVTTNPCALTGSDNVHSFPFGGNRTPDFAQGEAVWEGTQPLGNYLDFSINDPAATVPGACKEVNSVSPAILNMTPDEMTKCMGKDPTELVYKVFPGASPGTPPTPTVVLNQNYNIFVTYFYGFTPKAGWSLAADGPCNTPQQCGS